MNHGSDRKLVALVAHLLESDPELADSVDALLARHEPLLTSVEVEERLRIKSGTVRAMARDGRLPGYRLGREWRFLWSEVMSAVMRGQVG